MTIGLNGSVNHSVASPGRSIKSLATIPANPVIGSTSWPRESCIIKDNGQVKRFEKQILEDRESTAEVKRYTMVIKLSDTS